MKDITTQSLIFGRQLLILQENFITTWFAVTEFHYYWFQWRVLVSHQNAVLGAFFTLPKNISWGNTEMLLCTYYIGQWPKMGNGNGFWHHCRDSGMIIILASTTVGRTSESSLSLLRLCVCNKEIQDSCLSNLLCSFPLLLSSVFYCPCLGFSLLTFSLSDCLNEDSVWRWISNMAASNGKASEIHTALSPIGNLMMGVLCSIAVV